METAFDFSSLAHVVRTKSVPRTILRLWVVIFCKCGERSLIPRFQGGSFGVERVPSIPRCSLRGYFHVLPSGENRIFGAIIAKTPLIRPTGCVPAIVLGEHQTIHCSTGRNEKARVPALHPDKEQVNLKCNPSHPSRKNKSAARVGHPRFIAPSYIALRVGNTADDCRLESVSCPTSLLDKPC